MIYITHTINQASQMIRQLQASEQQNAQQLQNLAGQVPEPVIRQQLQSLQQKEQNAAKQLNQIASLLDQFQNNNQSGMAQLTGLGNSNSTRPSGMNMTGTQFGNRANQQMSSGMSGMGNTGMAMMGGQQRGVNHLNGMGQQNNRPLTSGLQNTANNQSGMGSNQLNNNNYRQNQSQTTSFGVGNLMNRR